MCTAEVLRAVVKLRTATQPISSRTLEGDVSVIWRDKANVRAPASKLHMRANLLVQAREEHHIIYFCDEENCYRLSGTESVQFGSASNTAHKKSGLLTEKHVFRASPPVKMTKAITVTINPGIKTHRRTALSVVSASRHFGESLSPASRIAMRTRTSYTKRLESAVRLGVGK